MSTDKMTIEEVKDELLKEGEDYGLTKGIPKPFLTLPGAQRVAKYYGYKHAFEIQESVEQHQEKFYFYRVICRVVSEGEIIGDMIGSCSTHDSGKGKAPPNSILKMAEKRAYVSAILYVVAGSGLFSADVEDMSPAELNVSEDGVKWFGAKWSNGFCAACNNKHISEGDMVGKVDGKWMAKDCYDHLQSVENSNPPEEESQEDKLAKTLQTKDYAAEMFKEEA